MDGKTWEFICFLSNQGRRVIAAEMGVGVSEVPSHTVDVRTRHILTVSDVMDWLKMEGDVEVKVRTDGSSFVIANAVGTIPGLKASRYMRLAQYNPVPLLLVVTQRPKHAVKEFTNKGLSVFVCDFKYVGRQGIVEKLKSKITESIAS